MNTAIMKARDIIAGYRGPKLRIMEVCGTHTHEIFRLGIRSLLPENVALISGPGCPVCVTPVSYIDEAIFLAEERHATICTFGDLVRVPGTEKTLADARSRGASIQVVYTPLDAVTYAEEHPREEVVFLSVGFETTTPSACLALKRAEAQDIANFSLLTANKTMPAAYEAMASHTDAYLYPGHVCAITGTSQPESLTKQGISGAVAGFTASELLTALAVILEKSRSGEPFFVNAYPRVVRPEGNPAARALVAQFMEPCDAEWRGLGVLEASGLQLRAAFAARDARVRFSIPEIAGRERHACHCGAILQGLEKPTDCPLYSTACTPDHPVGACMVSREGACSAYYLYGGLGRNFA
ncbi:MAG: hydrogenase formation protein HypD [Mitsuokella jalaludinii]|uniref:hydrogenase formation protein HypD n=2 Tax=uncultured Mitsuokella sp. TaxID=453120 RepID=UPI00259630F1|nr:hydrogenase formation protein HypD [uncultured Mitsuokella sp.]MCI7064501.1 hydrogenase formation protein HypD [Mitsuokella jalaludinii]